MTRFEKRLKGFLQNPSAYNYHRIEPILRKNGFYRVEAKGSHVKFKHPSLSHDLIIPLHNNDCKIFYRKLIAKTIKHLIDSKDE